MTRERESDERRNNVKRDSSHASGAPRLTKRLRFIDTISVYRSEQRMDRVCKLKRQLKETRAVHFDNCENKSNFDTEINL